MAPESASRKLAKPTTLIGAVDDCLSRHARGRYPVSLASTVSALRLEWPACDLDNRELADLVAIRAVETGCDVIFDADLLNEPDPDKR